jgi:exopolyphosphatase/guanosine-5'-triphosphate,3'-diphosphate pyrophosphatase
MSADRPTLDELRATGLFIRLQAFGRDHGLDECHALQVTRLALELFDQSAAVHRFGAPERTLLFSAAYLHDIGMCRGLRGHHKSSLDIIQAGDLSPLSDRERKLVAGIARYHRKAHPKSKHDHFSSLPPEDQDRVSRLASLLRVADALDRAHDGAVKAVDLEMSTRRIVLKAVSARDLRGEEDALRKKGRLFEELFGLRLALETVRPQEGR